MYGVANRCLHLTLQHSIFWKSYGQKSIISHDYNVQTPFKLYWRNGVKSRLIKQGRLSLLVHLPLFFSRPLWCERGRIPFVWHNSKGALLPFMQPFKMTLLTRYEQG